MYTYIFVYRYMYTTLYLMCILYTSHITSRQIKYISCIYMYIYTPFSQTTAPTAAVKCDFSLLKGTVSEGTWMYYAWQRTTALASQLHPCQIYKGWCIHTNCTASGPTPISKRSCTWAKPHNAFSACQEPAQGLPPHASKLSLGFLPFWLTFVLAFDSVG